MLKINNAAHLRFSVHLWGWKLNWICCFDNVQSLTSLQADKTTNLRKNVVLLTNRKQVVFVFSHFPALPDDKQKCSSFTLKRKKSSFCPEARTCYLSVLLCSDSSFELWFGTLSLKMGSARDALKGHKPSGPFSEIILCTAEIVLIWHR